MHMSRVPRRASLQRRLQLRQPNEKGAPRPEPQPKIQKPKTRDEPKPIRASLAKLMQFSVAGDGQLHTEPDTYITTYTRASSMHSINN